VIGESDIKEEVLCIDQFFLNNCRIKRMPNLQHTCINRLDLSFNLLAASVHLILSKYTVYYLDYLNLQSNNISYFKVITTEQEYKQEKYAVKNSPLNYFYGRVNQSIAEHTVIDVQNNKFFRCDCSLVRLLSDYQSIRISSERCHVLTNSTGTDTLKVFEEQCKRLGNSTKPGGASAALNRKVKGLFVLTCILLVVFSLVIIYYTCTDCLNNFHQSIQRVFYRCCNFNGKFTSRLSAGLSGVGSSGNGGLHNVNNIGVQYSKLVEDAAAESQIELNTRD
jgi:hypothetical protein